MPERVHKLHKIPSKKCKKVAIASSLVLTMCYCVAHLLFIGFEPVPISNTNSLAIYRDTRILHFQQSSS
jgi:hypothetical protein